MRENMEIKDSGARRQFADKNGNLGGVRDVCEGKGREDLLPLEQIVDLTHSEIISCINEFLLTHDKECIYRAIRFFCVEAGWDIWTCFMEVGIHFEQGALKYGDNNWRHGIQTHCYVDSALRHYFKYRRGDDDEPHNRAVVWNLLCLVWTMENLPQFDDLKGEISE